MTHYVWSPVYVDAMVMRQQNFNSSTSFQIMERAYVLQDAHYNVTGLATWMTLLGDADGSGVVDLADYDAWSAGSGMGGPVSGDLDSDGDRDLGDIDIWYANVSEMHYGTWHVTQRMVYDAYGNFEVLAGEPNPNGTLPYGSLPADWSPHANYLAWRHFHQGLEYSVETGWYMNRNRVYNPTMGRFAQQEPSGATYYVDGMNLYRAYAGSPLGYTDPSGENPIAAGIAAILLLMRYANAPGPSDVALGDERLNLQNSLALGSLATLPVSGAAFSFTARGITQITGSSLLGWGGGSIIGGGTQTIGTHLLGDSMNGDFPSFGGAEGFAKETAINALFLGLANVTPAVQGFRGAPLEPPPNATWEYRVSTRSLTRNGGVTVYSGLRKVGCQDTGFHFAPEDPGAIVGPGKWTIPKRWNGGRGQTVDTVMLTDEQAQAVFQAMKSEAANSPYYFRGGNFPGLNFPNNCTTAIPNLLQGGGIGNWIGIPRYPGMWRPGLLHEGIWGNQSVPTYMMAPGERVDVREEKK